MEPAPTNMIESSILDLFQTKSSSISFNSESDSDPESLPASSSEETALNHCDSSGLSGGSISPRAILWPLQRLLLQVNVPLFHVFKVCMLELEAFHPTMMNCGMLCSLHLKLEHKGTS